MDDLNGIRLVAFCAPDSTAAEETEVMCILQAVEEPRRQDDIIGYVVANPKLENIERAMLVLRATEYKIGKEDAVKLFWADDPDQPMPSSIKIIGRKH